MNFFGTDGIRGNVKTKLTPELVLNIGTSAGKIFKTKNIKTICIGYDPRVSSEYILNILIGGLTSQGINVINLGVVTTPCVSYTISKNKNIDCGIMISASHNPYYDNGIKFFDTTGRKISDELEQSIEDEMTCVTKIDIDKIGKSWDDFNLVKEYENYLVDLGKDLSGINLGLDLACGSSYASAKNVFEKLGANLTVIGDNPDGYNINNNIGSTHPELMQKKVIENNLDYAFCYDGDGDRIQLIDNTGELLDGDYILYILAKYLQKENKLKDNLVVSTVMANLGYLKALENLGIKSELTQVGDRYVMQELHKGKYSLGGEQSGHIILPEYITTGDGILTSVILSLILKEVKLEDIKKELIKYPQVLYNHMCEDKNKLMESTTLHDTIKEVEKELEGMGRVLVRPSGTEEMIRIMVEAKSEDICLEKIEKIKNKIAID